ncbi:MAG: DcaP family trimeric outer membrane transporter [Betaproteobacteria bacterium]
MMVSLAAIASPLAALAADPIAVTSDTKIQLYGFVRADATYDIASSNGDAGDWGSFLQTQPIDGSATANKHGDTYITARGSRFGMKGQIGDGGVNFKLEGDFNGTTAESGRPGQLGTNSTGFRIRHAYIEYAGFLVGQSWSNFEDLPALPETVQFNPTLTAVTPRQPQIRYTAKLSGSELSVALENAQSFTQSGNDFDRGTDITAKWTTGGDWGHVSLRGVEEQYRTDTGSTRHSTTGYEAAVSGAFNIGSTGRLVYGLFYGDGGGRYLWGSLLEGAVDTGTNISKFKSRAAHVGYTQSWTSNLRSNFVYSTIRFSDNPNAVANFHNKQLDQFHVNLFSGVAKNTEIGVEYADGRRKLMNPAVDATDNPEGRSTGHERRINLMLQANF